MGPADINPGDGGPADIYSSVWSPGTSYPSNQCPVDFNSWGLMFISCAGVRALGDCVKKG
jgi:hypothetical protein